VTTKRCQRGGLKVTDRDIVPRTGRTGDDANNRRLPPKVLY